MKKMNTWMRALLCALCVITLLSLISCSADMEIGNNTELAKGFLDSVLKDEYDSAVGMVGETIGENDFQAYWKSIRDVVKDASSYRLKQIGWNINTTNGQTVRTTAYQVNFDNGKTALFRVVTAEGVTGIAGLHFSDITAFQTKAEAIVPAAKVILCILSVLSAGFSIWMFVDCLRRKIKFKVLWAILMFVGVVFSLTLGDKNLGFHMFIGLILKFSSIVADPATQAFEMQLVFPLGAIVYLCLRKRLLLPVPVPTEIVSEFSDLSSQKTENEEASSDRPGES